MTHIREVITKDGSLTFYNEEVDECYHSKSGALDEALRKHVLPSNVTSLSKHTITIADVCFGLGYNSIVAIHEIKKQNPSAQIYIDAFEYDIEILKKITTLTLPEEYTEALNIVQNAIIMYCKNKQTTYCSNFVTIRLHIGDFRELTSCVASDSVDVVFFDPFSPQKHTHLWTQEVFVEMKRIMTQDGILTTYSCARMVREHMAKAGLFVQDGPIVGRRSPSTLAFKQKKEITQ